VIRIGMSNRIRRVLGAALLCSLMAPQMASAEGTGSLYGKFRPLTGTTDTLAASKPSGRYSGETGYYAPKRRFGPPVFSPPGHPGRGVPGAAAGRYIMSPTPEWLSGPRFRPDHRSRNATVRKSRPAYRAQPVPGPYIDRATPPGQTGPGYRFRPQGHSYREREGFPGDA